MQKSSLSVVVALVVVFLVSLAGSIASAESGDLDSHAKQIVERDRERIRQHLREVEKQLRAREIDDLPPELRRARRRNIERLHEYWKRGVFPHNTIAEERRPIFIDEQGRHCAVGYLMKESGWEEEARQIADRENLAYLPAMESPEVQDWVEQSGLTATEAALIQPTYCHLDVSYGQDRCGEDTGHVRRDTGYDRRDTGESTDRDSDTGESEPDEQDAGGTIYDAGDDSEDQDDESDDQDATCSMTDAPTPPFGFVLLALFVSCVSRRRFRH